MSRRKLNQNEEQIENQGRRWRSRTEPIACVKCDKVFHDNVSLVLHFESRHFPVENRSRSPTEPLACIKCDKVFFDNKSLVLHFESHLPGKISIPGPSSPLSLSLSPPYSSPSVETASPRVKNNCSRPSPVPVSSAPTMLPPINSSFDAGFNVPPPTHRSSTRPFMSQLGPRPAPHLRLPEQYVGRARFRSSTIPQPEQRDSGKEEEAGGENRAEEENEVRMGRATKKMSWQNLPTV